MSQDEFSSTISTSDVVITHAGVGTILDLLERGVCPVVVPRRRAREEHVDDHQGQIARLLAGLGLGVVSEVDALTTEKIMRAALHQTTERA
jgi:UDP-N-acetylglucosamine transferase subunit ALG13